MYNKVILLGRLGRDPELMQSANGTDVCKFSIATTSGYGEKQQTEWSSIVTFNRVAENCSKYLSKGSLVHVEGRLQTSKWQDKEGNDRYKTEIVAYSVQFVETNKNKQQETQDQDFKSTAPSVEQQQRTLNDVSDYDDSDIPF